MTVCAHHLIADPMTKPIADSFLHGPPSPLVVTLPCPPTSPFEHYARIASAAGPSFLFESSNARTATGRYSFFAGTPYETLQGKADTWTRRTADGHEEQGSAPFQELARVCERSQIGRPANGDLPPFFGGAVGYLSYDLVRQFETLPSMSLDDLGMPDLEFAFYDLVAAIDHKLGRLVLMFCPPLERFLAEPREKLYREGCDRLAVFEARLSQAATAWRPSHSMGLLTFSPEQGQSSYRDRVRRCQEYIAAGDIYQANLSHRFTVAGEALKSGDRVQRDLLAYDRLRRMNPSPFSGVLRFDGTSLISSSPERLVRLNGRHADTRPIAGTRPRGRTFAEDRRLSDELRANEKERAEHVMLVDLERNDLGRVCEFGTVQVDEFLALEQYSHVSHLVSNISGTLRETATGFDLLRALFPGGTITGVPKIRCMEVIEELEPVRRGAYTGSMGYISWSGDLDFNILIRTLVLRDNLGYLQVGAGIVADSDSAREYEETLYKAQAFVSAFA
jgi:para-aminobenzoate synthetase component I